MQVQRHIFSFYLFACEHVTNFPISISSSFSSAFHDTRNDCNEVIPLCKNPLKTFTWANFYSKKNQIKPYIVEALPPDLIDKLEHGLNVCRDRIYRTRSVSLLTQKVLASSPSVRDSFLFDTETMLKPS